MKFFLVNAAAFGALFNGVQAADELLSDTFDCDFDKMSI
jgi:hypothetical protein